MLKNSVNPAAGPDTCHTIYIQHRSGPVFNYQSKSIKYGAEGSMSGSAGNDWLTICSAWMTNPLDAIPPVEAFHPDPPVPLARVPLPLSVPFADTNKPIALNTQAKAPLPQEDPIVESPVSDQVVESDCLKAVSIPPPPRTDASAPRAETTKSAAAEAASECIAEEEESPPLNISAFQACEVDASDACAQSSPPVTSAAPLPVKWKHMSVSRRKIQGLLHYRKWWFFREVGISVEGKMLTGTPIFIQEDTLRLVNETYSYFIPMDNVDYIRTPDGYQEACAQFEESPFPETC